jgi:hypothetical protein
VIVYLVYRFFFKSKLVKGYAKKTGEWIACQVQDYDKDYYSGRNSAGVTIYFKKNEVRTRLPKDPKDTISGQCADAITNMNIYTLKA